MFSKYSSDLYVTESVEVNGDVTGVTHTPIADQDTFGMTSGINAASRFGLKGTEDLGNGMKVSFKLENGFSSDDGQLGNGGRLFGREASVTLSGAFGDVSFGRMGGLASSAGTYDIFALYTDAFDGGDNNIGSGFAMSDRYDNMITYATPEMAGLKVYAQYSFQQDGIEEDQVANNDRYMALGATYNVGNLGLVAVVDSFQYSNKLLNPDTVSDEEPAIYNPKDDGLTFNVGMNYDCGFTKTFAGVQIARHVKTMVNLQNVMQFIGSEDPAGDNYNNGLDGWAATVGTQFPVGSGSVTTAFYYADSEESVADEDGDKARATYYGISARYVYPLSTRTSLYTGAGWSKTNLKSSRIDEDLNVIQAYAGLTHSF